MNFSTISTPRHAASSWFSRIRPVLATAIIVFREVLEAALIVGIVMAASRGIRGRGGWVGGGVAGGILGAVIVAACAGTIASAAAGMGQEVFNAAVLFAAVGMLG